MLHTLSESTEDSTLVMAQKVALEAAGMLTRKKRKQKKNNSHVQNTTTDTVGKGMKSSFKNRCNSICFQNTGHST